MGNCLVTRPDDIKRISMSVGVDHDLEGKLPSKASSSDFENHEEVFKKIKKVRFADDRHYLGEDKGVVDNERRSQTVRIKVVISKKELLEMIERGGVTVGDDVVAKSSLLIDNRRANDEEDGFNGWKPGLESISEAI